MLSAWRGSNVQPSGGDFAQSLSSVCDDDGGDDDNRVTCIGVTWMPTHQIHTWIRRIATALGAREALDMVTTKQGAATKNRDDWLPQVYQELA